jgi:peptidoglycan/LPS O-acetylase OafA/YrhL
MNTPSISKKNNFDAIRLFASFLVLYDQSFALGGYKGLEILSYITNGKLYPGQLGVIIFFVISGFLVTQSLIRSSGFLDFLWKRFLRIYPGFFVVIIFSLFVVGPFNTTLPINLYFKDPLFYDYLKSLSLFFLHQNLPGCFIDNPFPKAINGSLWTLNFELTMYLTLFILGSVFFFFKRIQVFYLVLFLGIYRFVFHDNSIIPKSLLWDYMDINYFIFFGKYFMVGSGLVVFKSYIFKEGYQIIWGLVVCWFFILFFPQFGTLHILLISYLILQVGVSDWNIKFASKYGDLSYGTYIYAFPVQQSLANFLPHSVPFFVYCFFSFVITLLLAWCSWKFIERPALNFKNLFSGRKS